MNNSHIYAICGDIINISNTLVLESQTIELSGNINFDKIYNDVSINTIIFNGSLNSNKDFYNYLVVNYSGVTNEGDGNALKFHPTENILLNGRATIQDNARRGKIDTIDLRTDLNNLTSTGYQFYNTEWAESNYSYVGAYNSCFMTNTDPPTIYTVQQKPTPGNDYFGDFGFYYDDDWYTFGKSFNHASFSQSNYNILLNDAFYYRTQAHAEANCPEVEFHGDDSGNIFIVHSRYNNVDGWALYDNKSLQIYEISNNNGFDDIRRTQDTGTLDSNGSYEFTDYWQTSDINLDTTSNKCCSHISADGNYVAYGVNFDNNYTGKIVILKRMQWKQWNKIQTITGKAINEFFGSHLVFNYDASILVTSNNPYNYNTTNGYYDITQSNNNTIFTRIYQRDSNNNYIQMGNDIDGYNAQISRANNIVANISSDNLYVNFYKYVNNDWQKYGYSIKHNLTLNIGSNLSKPIIALNYDCTLVAISNSVYRANNRTNYDGEIELYERKNEYMNFKKIITDIGKEIVSTYSNGLTPDTVNLVTARYMNNLNLHNFV